MEANNAAAMRKALNVVLDALTTISAHEDDIEFVRTWIDLCEKTIKAALAKPLRNCDVGTAEEQEKRFENFTAKHWHLGKTEFQWGQMPYESEAK